MRVVYKKKIKDKIFEIKTKAAEELKQIEYVELTEREAAKLYDEMPIPCHYTAATSVLDKARRINGGVCYGVPLSVLFEEEEF